MKIIVENKREKEEVIALIEFLRNYRIHYAKRGRNPIFWESSTKKHPWIGEEIKKGQSFSLDYDKLIELINCEIEIQGEEK